MCGIVGAYWNPADDREARLNAILLEEVIRKSAVRGADGWGIGVWDSDTQKATVWKYTTDPAKADVKERIQRLGSGSSIIFATRAAPVTEGGVTEANIHLHIGDEWMVVHNGIISNDHELRDEWGLGAQLRTDVDTEVVAHLRELVKDPQQLAELLTGGFALAMIHKHTGELEISRNYKTLWQTARPGLYVVASEAAFLEPVGGIIVQFPKESYLRIAAPLVALDKFDAQYISHVPEMSRERALVVISGGMDSSLVAYVAKKCYDMDVTLFHVNYKQKSDKMELLACEAVAHGLGVPLIVVDANWLGDLGASPLTSEEIDVPLGRESSKTSLCWTPARNLVFLSMAAAYAEAKGIGYILYGSNLEEEGPAWKDNDQAAVEAFDDAFFYGTLGGVRLFNVLGRLMKRDIIALGTHLGVPLDKTCSCDEPVCRSVAWQGWQMTYPTIIYKWLACGRCGCCHNRRHAYMQARLDDPQVYAYDLIDHYPSTEHVGETDIDDIIVNRLRWPTTYADEKTALEHGNTRALINSVL